MAWITGAAIMGGASLGSALIGSSSADKASKAQAGATDRATALSQQQFDATRADQAPYRSAGISAMEQLRRLLGIQPGASGPVTAGYSGSLVDSSGGVPTANAELYGSDPGYRKAWDDVAQWHQGTFNSGYTNASNSGEIERMLRSRLPQQGDQSATASPPSTLDSPLNRKFSVNDFWADPVTQLGYQSGLDLGKTALYNASPLTTGRDSGAALKELTKFGTDYSGSKAGESQTRFENTNSGIFNKLMAMIGGGQVATQATSNAGTNMANTNAGLISAGGNAQGASQIAKGNAYGGALGNLSNWWQNQQNNQQQQRMWDQMIGARTNGGFAL